MKNVSFISWKKTKWTFQPTQYLAPIPKQSTRSRRRAFLSLDNTLLFIVIANNQWALTLNLHYNGYCLRLQMRRLQHRKDGTSAAGTENPGSLAPQSSPHTPPYCFSWSPMLAANTCRHALNAFCTEFAQSPQHFCMINNPHPHSQEVERLGQSNTARKWKSQHLNPVGLVQSPYY